MTSIAILCCAAAFAVLAAAVVIRRRNLHLWIGPYLRQRCVAPRPRGPIDVLLCIADHFEPYWGGASEAVASARVEAWVREYPQRFSAFRDSDGRPPRHTFFYPIEQYDARHVEALAGLCRAGFGEVEVHLHHDNDTAENLERVLLANIDRFAHRHGLLGRWPDGRIAYGFVHGNWALDNSRPDGRWCGVDNELDILVRSGCYADFTMPSAPDATQTRIVNSIYYARGHAGCRKAHNSGTVVGRAPPPEGSLLMIQGPLSLWRPRGLLPKIENGCLQASQPPTMARLDQWIRAGVRVPCRPDWFFVKLHTHGATEANQRVLLGPTMEQFHRDLAARAAQCRDFRFHYVTAREMYNLAKAAESGYKGPVADAFHTPVALVSPHNPGRSDFSAPSLKSPSPATASRR